MTSTIRPSASKPAPGLYAHRAPGWNASATVPDSAVVTFASQRGGDIEIWLAVDRGGVVVGGAAYDDSRHDTAAWALVRFRQSGGLDRSFGKGGILLSDFGTGADWVGALATQRDGKLVAAGEVYSDQAVARYLPR